MRRNHYKLKNDMNQFPISKSQLGEEQLGEWSWRFYRLWAKMLDNFIGDNNIEHIINLFDYL